MRAMVLEEVRHPLILKDIPCPIPYRGELLIKVKTCGVCRTDLYIVDGELPHPKLPLILVHQAVGFIEKLGEAVSKHRIGDRVGIPRLGKTCHACEYIVSQNEKTSVITPYLPATYEMEAMQNIALPTKNFF